MSIISYLLFLSGPDQNTCHIFSDDHGVKTERHIDPNCSAPQDQ